MLWCFLYLLLIGCVFFAIRCTNVDTFTTSTFLFIFPLFQFYSSMSVLMTCALGYNPRAQLLVPIYWTHEWKTVNTCFWSFRQRSSNIYLMSKLHLSDNEASLTSCPVCMLSHVSALPATHWTCSMAHWHAHMQNIAYCRQSSAVAHALGVPKHTHR